MWYGLRNQEKSEKGIKGHDTANALINNQSFENLV